MNIRPACLQEVKPIEFDLLNISMQLSFALTTLFSALTSHIVYGNGLDGVKMLGGIGFRNMDVYSPGDGLEQRAWIDEIYCRGNNALDYIKVTHTWGDGTFNAGTGQPRRFNKVFEYGRSRDGKDQGAVRPNGGHMKAISVWVCGPGGKHSGRVCGMSFQFTNSPPHMCGKVDGEPTTITFGNHDIHAFVTQYPQDNTITTIGWSYKQATWK